MPFTVADYIADRFVSLGITECFGVPGDYAFPLDDALCSHRGLRWINSTNELNAGYAADGYARKRGMGLICTTYGVGELSALNAVAGSYSESVVVFHLVGMPDVAVKEDRVHFHHSANSYETFVKVAGLLSASAVILTDSGFREEIEQVIEVSLREQKPGYIGVPYSVATKEIEESASRGEDKTQHPLSVSASGTKSDILSSISNKINSAKTCLIVPAKKLRRLGLSEKVLSFSLSCNIPYMTFPLDKGVLPETAKTFLGCYSSSGAGEAMRSFIHNVDVVIEIGDVLYTDFSLDDKGNLPFDPSHIVRLGVSSIELQGKEVQIDDLGEVLESLSSVVRVFEFSYPTNEPEYGDDCRCVLDVDAREEISDDLLARTLQCLLPPETTIISDVGSSMDSLTRIKLNEGGDFLIQGHYASIGWSVSATLGVCLESSCAQQTVVTVVGDGAFQFTMNDVASFAKYKIHPIFIIIKNDGYRIERRIHKVNESREDYSYNDIQNVNYSSLFKALGCTNWFMANVSTHGMLVHALRHALERGSASGSLIVINLKKY